MGLEVMTNFKLNYISFIMNHTIVVHCSDRDLKRKLRKKLMAKMDLFNWSIFRIAFTDKIDLAKKLMILKDDFLFSYGKEWSPSEIVQYLQRLDLFKCAFKEVVWKNDKEYLIYKVNYDGTKNLLE